MTSDQLSVTNPALRSARPCRRFGSVIAGR